MAKVKRRKNKNTKLIFEIATAVIPIYIIVNLLVSVVINQSVADAFLNSKQQLLTAQMRRVYKYTDVLKTQWYYDKWESYGPDLRLEFTDNELRDI
ncbi:MAG: hypothetical protein J6S64_02515 [Bacteroidales bacterium]|nr:hypothetical protein [Bacteroidales bacterium]